MSTIENNKTFEEFRERCEDKNTLVQKNSLYVGKGTNKTLSNGTKIYETEAIAPPSSNSDVLAKNSSGGLSWMDIVDVVNKSSKNISNATNATNTDFTNAEWIYVTDADTGAINLVEGATYEVMIYDTSRTDVNESCGFITLNNKMANSLMDISITESTLGITYARSDIIQQSSTRIVVQYSSVLISYEHSKGTYGQLTMTNDNSKVLKFKYRRIR